MVHVSHKFNVSAVIVLLIALLLTACGQPTVNQPATANPSGSGQTMNTPSQPTDALTPSGADAGTDGPDTAVSGAPGQPGGEGGGGVLQGQVSDSRGTPIAGVMVVPVSTDTPPQAVPEIAVMTNEEGRYQWTLSPGAYTLTFNAEGYTPATHDINVNPNQSTTLDVTLQQQ